MESSQGFKPEISKPSSGIFGIASFQHVLNSVAKLPSYYHNPELEMILRNACLEAWFVNLRALIEFFEIKGHDYKSRTKDYKYSQYVRVKITHKKNDLLLKAWQISSKSVVHLSKYRGADVEGLDFDLSIENMLEHVEVILEMTSDFLEALKTESKEEAFLVEVALASAKNKWILGK
jgi:hypothetical protein